MLPRLNELEPATRLTRDLVRALGDAGFEGETHVDSAARLLAATDNSVYQILPQAVVHPRHHQDVVTLFRAAADPRFEALTLTPRGGGTGTNGQALTTGVVVDVSRHMRRILEIDPERRVARVEPGVVLDQLNNALKPHGLFFAPNLSPSSRATIGGMVATDASGEGSRVYGKTSQHLLGLRAVLIDGSVLDARPRDAAGLAAMKAEPGLVGHVHREVDRVLREQAEHIVTGWPTLTRYVTGYNLAMARGEHPDGLDLTWILAGAEGTLGLVTEATLKLTPLPKARRLVVFKYQRFEDALASAEVLVAADPGAIETIDETVLSLAREDVVFDAVKDYLVDAPGDPPTRTVNLVEFRGDDPAALDAKLDALLARTRAAAGQPGQPVGWVIAKDEPARLALWSLRKKGVGLLGATKGARKPVPFVEDTVVPPENLAAYVAEFRAILEAEGLRYGMFGHVDVGCLHVRPALDLKDPEDEKRLVRISDAVHALVRRHGGVIWGEHGKGMRSAYSPEVFGEVLFSALCEVKGAFDPKNRLNPGKVATPPDQREALVGVAAPLRGHLDRQVAPAARERFALSLDCNGNGQCFDYHPDHVMCPSSKVTRDRVHSPKGRAGVMREWLRQLSNAGFDAGKGGRPGAWRVALGWPARVWRSVAARFGRYDYSREVYDAMAGCLACKACATQCPVKVDVPSFRAEFIDLYHRRYRRPLKDHLVAGLEALLPLMARVPRLVNALVRPRPMRWLVKQVAGIVDTPTVAVRSLKRGLAARGLRLWSPAELAAASPPEDAVILVQDAFTSFYEPEVVLAVVDVARALGRTPYVLRFAANGKALHVKGFLRRFERRVAKNVAAMRPVAALGRPIVGVDPAVVLTWRDEYPAALGPGAERIPVLLLQEWLRTVAPPAALPERAGQGASAPYRLFGHCTEKTAVTGADRLWAEVFGAFGLPLEVVEVGCCGMSGFYGHDAEHAEESRGIFEMSWARHLPEPGAADVAEVRGRVLVTGFSCRSQVERLQEHVPRHPIQALAEHLTR
ncbi:MAG: FAD-binding oxidoreductase [Deltaproteobacteria bacterium]|nr:MAG: FAD-binding oxidoreductase [Deltaproteobacteria bacterium]